MRTLNYIFIIALLAHACKEPYDDPPIQAVSSSLVVECTITTEPPPYAVKLTTSVAYNSSSYPKKVSNAKISILDDAGNTENVVEQPSGSGNYMTSAKGMQGQVGRSYKLIITLTDGKDKIYSTYESDWVKINELPKIDSLYAETGQLQTLMQNSDGSYFIYTRLGLNVYMDANPPANQDYYYKFNSSMIQEYTQKFYPGINGRYTKPAVLPVTIYGWYTSQVHVTNDLIEGSSQYPSPIKKHFIGFIPELFSTVIDTFNDEPISAGNVTTTTIYSVSNKIYQIFTEENTQTQPANSIFDPVPTQLTSNIKCTSDTTKSVFGYFNAASVIHEYHYFFWVHVFDKIFSYKIDSMPPGIVNSGSDTVIAPSFWFYNNGKYK